MHDDLTSDEPYEPEDPEILGLTGVKPGKSMAERANAKPAWTQPKVHEAGTKLKRDPVFEAKLAEIERKMDAGTPLSETDADYAMNRAILSLFRSPRPSMRAKAIALMQNGRIKKILDTHGGRVDAPPDHGLSLPGPQ